jgi:hypothetical protein
LLNKLRISPDQPAPSTFTCRWATDPTPAELQAQVQQLAERVGRYLERRGEAVAQVQGDRIRIHATSASYQGALSLLSADLRELSWCTRADATYKGLICLRRGLGGQTDQRQKSCAGIAKLIPCAPLRE